jgi:chromatin remodeling complex protein RSC6
LPNNSEDTLSIYLTLISNPPKYEVDPLLEKIVGIRTGTRVEVLDAFWLYVKSKKLQDVENKEIINSD